MTLAALFAGAFIGIGLGIIFKYGGTTGGVDIIARLAHKYVGWKNEIVKLKILLLL